MIGFKGVSVLFHPVENLSSLEFVTLWWNQVSTEWSRLLINCTVLLDIPTVLAEILRPVASLQLTGSTQWGWQSEQRWGQEGNSHCKVPKCHPASREQWEWEDAQGLMAIMQCCRSAGGNCSSLPSLELAAAQLLLPALTLLLGPSA